MTYRKGNKVGKYSSGRTTNSEQDSRSRKSHVNPREEVQSFVRNKFRNRPFNGEFKKHIIKDGRKNMTYVRGDIIVAPRWVHIKTSKIGPWKHSTPRKDKKGQWKPREGMTMNKSANECYNGCANESQLNEEIRKIFEDKNDTPRTSILRKSWIIPATGQSAYLRRISEHVKYSTVQSGKCYLDTEAVPNLIRKMVDQRMGWKSIWVNRYVALLTVKDLTPYRRRLKLISPNWGIGIQSRYLL